MRTSVLGSRAADLTRNFNTVKERQSIRQDGDIRLRKQRLLDGPLPVGRNRHNLPSSLRLDYSLQASANDLMGVRDENAEHGSQRLWALDERARVRSPWFELTRL